VGRIERTLSALVLVVALAACGGDGVGDAGVAACEDRLRAEFERAAAAAPSGQEPDPLARPPAECAGVSDRELARMLRAAMDEQLSRLEDDAAELGDVRTDVGRPGSERAGVQPRP
jgi:hypothetical protein